MTNDNRASTIDWPLTIFMGAGAKCLLHGVVSADCAVRMRQAFEAAPVGKLEVFAGGDRAEVDGCVSFDLAAGMIRAGFAEIN